MNEDDALMRRRRVSPADLLLFPVAVVCFVAAAATDAMYAMSEYLMWLHFSEWLIAAGIAFGVLAGLALIVARLSNRSAGPGLHAGLLCIALVAELVNAFVHTADGWTAVMPAGMTLSILGAILALASVGALWRLPVTRAGPAGAWR